MTFWLAFVLGGVLAALEWRRPRRRARLMRVAAALLAALALGMLTQPRPLPVSAVTEASLWTIGAPRESTSPAPHFALPDAEAPPAGAVVVPDLGTLRRLHPRLTTLHVLGYGLSPAEAARAAGLQVRLRPAGPSAGVAFVALAAPETTYVGQPLELRGRVVGAPAQAEVQLDLPGSPKLKVSLGTEGKFELRTPPLAAAGRTVATLTVLDDARELARESLGVAIVPPPLPRVLALAGAPQLDLSRLQAWYAEVGGDFALQTLVSRQRTRAAAVGSAAADFAELTAEALENFDLVLLDPARLPTLSAAERGALEAAVRARGLGLLLLGPAAREETLSPWKLEPLPAAESAPTERLVRPRWPERAVDGQTPLPTLPFLLTPAAGQRALLSDVQGRVLAATAPLGRGTVAVTLLRETWRWPQANESAAFADYWSGLLRALARRRVEAAFWRIEPMSGPEPRVGEPVRLVWQGNGQVSPSEIRLEAPDSASPDLVLSPAQDPREPGRWICAFWPTRPGWHRVSANGQPGRDFHVADAGAWQALERQRRADFTQELARAGAGASATVPPSNAASATAGWWIALLLGALSFLWIEARVGKAY